MNGRYLSQTILDHDESALKASQTSVEGTLAKQGWEQRPQVFVHVTNHTALAFPWHPAAPLGGQAQTEDFAIAHPGRWPATGRHLRLNMVLVEIIHNNVQSSQEGFEIESMAMSPLVRKTIWTIA